MNALIETRKEVKVAYVRHVGPYGQCEIAWNKLCGWAGPKGQLTEDTEAYGICYDDPQTTPEAELRYDACISIGTKADVEAPIGIQTIPAGEYLSVEHHGPYEKLGESWMASFQQVLPEQKREFDPARPCFEQYLNDPTSTPPEKLETKLFIPVK